MKKTLFLVLFSLLAFNVFASDLAKSSLDKFSGKDFKQDLSPKIIMEEKGNFDFELDPQKLNRGDVQTYSALLQDWEIDEEMDSFMRNLDVVDVLDANGGRVSYLKMAYIIPNQKSSNFTPRNMITERFVEKTNLGVTFIENTINEEDDFISLSSTKAVPFFDDVTTEFEYNGGVPKDRSMEEGVFTIDEDYYDHIAQINLSKYGLPDRVLMAHLVYTSDQILPSAQSLNYYYDLPDGSGLLTINYVVSRLNFRAARWLKRKILENAPQSARISNFIKETAHTIKQNRLYNF